MENKTLDTEYWQSRWEKAETGWDIGYASPPITSYMETVKDKSARILIPGCGSGYEGHALHDAGFTNVYLCDLASAPLEKFASRVPTFPKTHLLHADFFEIQLQFDFLIEQTFFCALHPKMRSSYAKKAADLLNNDGILTGVLFNRTFPHEGPPFGGDEVEYRAYFEPYFEFLRFKTCTNSIPPRQGSELFIELKKE